MGKGANGEGGIRQRKDGRREARFTVQTATGPKRRTVYGKTRKEAMTKLAKAIANEDGLVFDAVNLTVGHHAGYLQPSTARQSGPTRQDVGAICGIGAAYRGRSS